MNIFYMVTATALSFVILTWLALRSWNSYMAHNTEAYSTNYADVIKEGHGRLTLFLRVSFILILIWTIIYPEQHSTELSVIFSG